MKPWGCRFDSASLSQLGFWLRPNSRLFISRSEVPSGLDDGSVLLILALA
ncbi:MAG: hypothetical protein Q8O16_01285 [Dehalococcoidia bacterium]|nr:hypothetical protein [Dehalococcoidia bacterium]